MREFLILILLLISTGGSNACTCDGLNTIKEEFDASNVVAYGRVISIERVAPLQTIDPGALGSDSLRFESSWDTPYDFLRRPSILQIRLEVLTAFKGASTGQVMTVFTPVSGASCGYTWFKVGEDFVVYGLDHSFWLEGVFSNWRDYKSLEAPSTFWTHLCSRTTEAVDQEVAALKSLQRQ